MPPSADLSRGVLAAVAAGGVLGTCSRYAVAQAWPASPGDVPWSTLLVNVTGSLLIGVLVGVRGRPRRPATAAFLGPGLLGGWTTFSAYAVEAHGLLVASRPVAAAAYAVGTLVLCLVAVVVGQAAVRRGRRS